MAKAVKHPVPKNEAEAAQLLGELENLKLRLDEKQVKLDLAVNKLVTAAERDAEVVSQEFGAKFIALKTYATTHKLELTEAGKRRSQSYATGTLGWRSLPAGISVPRSAKDVALLIERILAARKPKFLKRRWVLNVEAMEAAPEEASAIEGIKRRKASETFFVKFTEGAEISQKIKLKTPSAKDPTEAD